MFAVISSWLLAFLAAGFLAAACASTRTPQSPGEIIDDGALTTRVMAALASDPFIEGSEISVQTNRGVVQLSGSVRSPAEKSTATKVARSVSGVQEVRNDLALARR